MYVYMVSCVTPKAHARCCGSRTNNKGMVQKGHRIATVTEPRKFIQKLWIPSVGFHVSISIFNRHTRRQPVYLKVKLHSCRFVGTRT